uniref:(northern house mosquito) hypothetical protein n=1 Tax=Culex pipiens TaxID=7175 RepID=A0A8D8I6C5_CULPI
MQLVSVSNLLNSLKLLTYTGQNDASVQSSLQRGSFSVGRKSFSRYVLGAFFANGQSHCRDSPFSSRSLSASEQSASSTTVISAISSGTASSGSATSAVFFTTSTFFSLASSSASTGFWSSSSESSTITSSSSAGSCPLPLTDDSCKPFSSPSFSVAPSCSSAPSSPCAAASASLASSLSPTPPPPPPPPLLIDEADSSKHSTSSDVSIAMRCSAVRFRFIDPGYSRKFTSSLRLPLFTPSEKIHAF